MPVEFKPIDTYCSSIFGSGVFVKGRCEFVSHMDVVNADIAGANICPWKLDDSIPAANTLAKHPHSQITKCLNSMCDKYRMMKSGMVKTKFFDF